MFVRVAWVGTVIVCFAASLVPVSGTQAAFGVANMTFSGISGLPGTVTYYDKETLSAVTTGAIGIGQLTWNVTASTDPLVPVGSGFTTFCIELERILSSPATYDVGLIRDAPDPGTSSPFPSGDIGLARELALTKLYDIAYLGLSTPTQYAAFQLAVWEISHETTGTFNVSTSNGTFYLASGASPVAVTTANLWLAAVSGPPVTHALDVYALTQGTNQDQIFPVPAPPGGGVPEPTAVMTWGVILLGVCGVSCRARANV